MLLQQLLLISFAVPNVLSIVLDGSSVTSDNFTVSANVTILGDLNDDRILTQRQNAQPRVPIDTEDVLQCISYMLDDFRAADPAARKTGSMTTKGAVGAAIVVTQAAFKSSLVADMLQKMHDEIMDGVPSTTMPGFIFKNYDRLDSVERVFAVGSVIALS